MTLSPCGYVDFSKGLFVKPTEVLFSCTPNRPLDYPEEWADAAFAENLTPLALNTIISFPTDAIDQAALAGKGLGLLVRIPPTVVFKKNAIAEIRYQLDDGAVIYSHNVYQGGEDEYSPLVPSEIIGISLADLKNVPRNDSGASTTETLTISIQPLGLKAYLD